MEKEVDGLFTSKIRYGLQLMGRVRTSSEDQLCGGFKAIQLVQNRMLRTLNHTTLKDKVSTESLLTKFNMTSVNRLNAQVKFLEMWKALNMESYPLKIKQQSVNGVGACTRASQKGRLIEIGRTNVTRNSSTSDAIRIWNLAPSSITEANSLYQAKIAIKSFIKLLPL